MTIEIFKDIPGYEGAYQVSNLGRVRSLPRTKCRGQILSLLHKKPNYWAVTLSSEGVKKTWNVHVLVLSAFVGKRPKGKGALHKDGDGKNNVIDNLYWGNQSANGYDVSLQNKRRVSRETVSLIKIAKGTHKEIGELFGVSKSHVTGIKNGVGRKHG